MKKIYSKPEILTIVHISQPVMLNVYSGNGDDVVNNPNDVLSKRRRGYNGWEEDYDYEEEE